MASAAAIVSSPGPSASPMVGAPAVAASTAKITMRDDLSVVVGAIATMGGSTGYCPSTVGVSW
jgi:hypothetical protein